MAWARGSEATPVLDPAISTPNVRTPAPGAKAMSAVPAVANTPATTDMTLEPKRGVSGVATTTPTQ